MSNYSYINQNAMKIQEEFRLQICHPGLDPGSRKNKTRFRIKSGMTMEFAQLMKCCAGSHARAAFGLALLWMTIFIAYCASYFTSMFIQEGFVWIKE